MMLARLTRRTHCTSSCPSFSTSAGASTLHGEGEVLRKEHRFGQEEVSAFATLSGDSNPIHTLHSAAAAAGFSSCVVHGMLCASLFPSLISSRFPGALFEAKTLRFKEPVLVGDCLEAEAKILSINPAKDGLRVDLRMDCYKKETRVLVLEGSSTVIVPNK